MYLKVFLDANILLDIHDDTRPFHQASLKAISQLAEKADVVLFTSCDIVTTLYYVLSKKDKALALNTIMDISELCDVVEFSNKEVLESCHLMQQVSDKFSDLEDTIQYVLAKKAECDLILSNDKRFISPDIELLSSEVFILKK